MQQFTFQKVNGLETKPLDNPWIIQKINPFDMETEEDQALQDAQAVTVGITGAQERAARAFHLLQQAPLSTQAIADHLGMTYNGAKALLWKVSRAVPIYYCEDSGQWIAMDDT